MGREKYVDEPAKEIEYLIGKFFAYRTGTVKGKR
jgi:hypothetical protein